jgi:hypothetical protein
VKVALNTIKQTNKQAIISKGYDFCKKAYFAIAENFNWYKN